MISVNNREFNEAEILAEMQYHQAGTQRQAMVSASETLIIGELIRQRAAQLGLPVDEASDEAQLQQVIDQDCAIPKASEQECRQYYEQNLNKFCSSPLLAARHILLIADPKDSNARIAADDKAKQLLAALQEGEDFSALAKQYSACTSATTGGQLGQVSKGQTVAEFERQVFSAPVGLIAHPIETRYGYHIVEVLQRVDGKQLPYEMVSDRIADYLNEKVKRKAIAQYIETLIAGAEITGFDFDVSDSPLLQ